MALISQDMKFLTSGDLVDKLGTEAQSALDKFKAIVPTTAFPLDQMFALKENMQTTIEGLPVSEASTLSVLSDSLATASNQDISAILFQSGINPDTFSVETFGLDVASLTDFQSSVTGHNASLNGGCDALLALENLVADIGNEIDVNNTFQPISDYMEDLAKSVEGAVISVKEQLDALSSDSILTDIADAAESVVGAITSDVEALALAIQSDIESIDITNVLESLEAEAKAIADTFEASIENILGNVDVELIAFKDSVDACFQHSKMVNEVKLKNFEDTVDNIR